MQFKFQIKDLSSHSTIQSCWLSQHVPKMIINYSNNINPWTNNNLLFHFRNLYFATKNKSLMMFNVLNSLYIYSLDDIYSESLHYSFVLCWITLACKYLPGKGDNTDSKLNNFIPAVKSVKALVFVHWLVNITLFRQKKTEFWTLLIAGDLCMEKPPALCGNIW